MSRKLLNKGVPIPDFIEAYDAVIPGYAWAWHDANLADPRIYRHIEKGWRDKRRKIVNLDERCITLYGFDVVKTPAEGRRQGVGDCPLPALAFYNRGYVPLFACTFPDLRLAVQDLYQFRDRGSWEPDKGKHFFTKDATPFNQRCHITMAVLQYVKDKATTIIPVWQNFPDLAQQS